jgi:hypothetical protein
MKHSIDIYLTAEQESELQRITDRFNAVYEGQQDNPKAPDALLQTIINSSLQGALQTWDTILTAKQKP